MKTLLAQDKRGVTAVEFSLLALPLMVMICSSIEVGRMIYTKVALDSALAIAARASSADMDETEANRDTALRTRIANRMSMYPKFNNEAIQITTIVYANFGDASPEPYTDSNGNKQYDPAAPGKPAEAYVDRNNNNQWDAAIVKTGTMGGLGDVVAYKASMKSPLLFKFLGTAFDKDYFSLESSIVTRNEPAKSY